MNPRRVALALAALALAVAACGPAAESPSGVVRRALDLAAAKDLDGLRALACAGQEAAALERLGLPAADLEALLPGADLDALRAAVTIDVAELEVGDETISGDTATVEVAGDVGVTFDAVAIRPILERFLADQGRTLTDAQLDALIRGLERTGQAIPIRETLALAREDGAWRICATGD